MPWCPKCKTEYRFGITKCSDCKSLLVEELVETEEKKLLTVFQSDKHEQAEKLLEFLKSEGFSGCELVTDEENNSSILVYESELKRAEKILSVFAKIEAEKEFSSLDEEEKKRKLEESFAKIEKERNVRVYTRAKDRYKENVSSAWTFLLTGIAGLGFTLVNILGYLNFMAGELQYIVSVLLFSSFILLGIASFKKNKGFEELAKKEEETEVIYKDWLNHFPEENLRSIWNKELSPEENEIVLVNHLSEKLVENFPAINENFADSLADEYFNEIREKFIEA